ncbi:MAG: sulfoxide reductase heme-binding subunit YedZ [Anaerolineae bacterium]|nr:MAG: sulfoxide reductase heme-binding subunit YedZ [Anaerolineae bacterium]
MGMRSKWQHCTKAWIYAFTTENTRSSMKKPNFTWLQVAVHLGGWFPLAALFYDFLTDNLTANPIQAIEQRTGYTALVFLTLSLACTPLAFLGWKEMAQRRKALGVYGFLYAALHVVVFVAVDYGLNLNAILRDVGTKQYILLGTAAFLLLVPLAVTSFNYWMKRLGRNWKRLHRLVYLIVPLVILHFFLARKGNLLTLSGDIVQPLIFSSLVVLLLLLRLGIVKRGLVRVRTRLLSARTPTAG